MMVMTAKVDMKKIAIVLAIAAVLIVALIMLFSGGSEPTAAAASEIATNDDRVKFLTGFGWSVTSSPVESSQVKIPETSTDVFDRYNTLQKSQGYDLSQYAGKTVMRYVYKVTNYPGATEPVYATLLIYKNQVIGGDVTDTAAKGVVRGFRMPESSQETTPATTAPATAPSAA
ncbi:MAG: DUF4830 domain-containing protein [Oscillospiraceae bacterium]|nr:DUF4830 domain-containing protein [Oscillospiraceae bacterium]